MNKKKVHKKGYEKSLIGVHGTIGQGDLLVNYIQLNLKVTDLDLLGLVSEIPGSEKWPIRQLFQRDIDKERVTKDIIPYFQNDSIVKFFNPLTIAVLPIDSAGRYDGGLSEHEDDPHEGYEKAFSIPSLYKVSYDELESTQAIIEWNTSKVKLIAIDGQHRLSALKRLYGLFKQDPLNQSLARIGFANWSVPIVLVAVGHEASGVSAESILEKTRSIFVTINKQAKQPTRSRTILLNDFSVTAICCQEVLDKCRDHGVSLAFFNWRDSREDDSISSGTSLIAVDELEDIFISFFVGEDCHDGFGLSGEQKDTLFWEDQSPVPDVSNSASLRDAVKKRFRETIEPSFFYILNNCHPISGYVKFLNKIETGKKNDIETHAWSRVVYGTDFSDPIIEKEIDEKRVAYIEECARIRSELGKIFSRMVGLRGIFSGFEYFCRTYWECVAVISWEDLAGKYVKLFNGLYDGKIFERPEFIENIATDRSDSIINYKPEQVRKALGALIGYSVVRVSDFCDSVDLEDIRDQVSKTLVSSYRKLVRPEVKDRMVGSPAADINREVNAVAAKKAENQLKKIDAALNKFMG